MRPSVFVDWFRTIADQSATSRRYGETMARLLHGWYGFPLAEGIRVHDQVLEWSMAEWPKRRDASEDYVTAMREQYTDEIYKTFELYGRPLSISRDEACALARRLTRAVASQIDTVYPDARPALNELIAMGCRVFPATGADRNFLEGLLEGSGLRLYFEKIITADMVNVDKRRPRFWKAMLERTASSARTSFAVDDDATVLEAAQAMGLHGVLIDPEDGREEGRVPRAIRLRDLAGLPAVVAAGVREGRHRG